jgi:hypothetical protein
MLVEHQPNATWSNSTASKSEIQRKRAAFSPKPSIIAAILQIFEANRTRETSSIAFIYPGFQLFSPRAELAVRFRITTVPANVRDGKLGFVPHRQFARSGGIALAGSCRTIRRCTPSFFATSRIEPVPCGCSRLISSNSSTSRLLSIAFPVCFAERVDRVGCDGFGSKC